MYFLVLCLGDTHILQREVVCMFACLLILVCCASVVLVGKQGVVGINIYIVIVMQNLKILKHSCLPRPRNQT